MSVMEKMLTPFQALEEAVKRARGQAALARICGVSQAAVWKWVQTTKRLPPRFVFAVEAATGVPRYLLCPNDYPRDMPPPPEWEENGEEAGPIVFPLSSLRKGNRTHVLDTNTLRRAAR